MTKKNFSSFMLLLMLVLLLAMGQQTRADENVFGTTDPYLAPANSISTQVNLFTGDLVANINLVTLTGRGGLSFPINLNYSSNVVDVFTADNQDRQASVVGLGWSLDIPAIVGVAQHKSSTEVEYGKLWYVAGGVANELISTGSTSYKTENYRFWQISTTLGASQEDWDITKWEIVDENGTTFTFEHKCQRTQRLYAEGTTTCPPETWSRVLHYEIMGYRWNLTKIQDVFGNSISLSYLDPSLSGNEDLTENVSDRIQDGACHYENFGYASYTKAFYIDKIKDDASGKCVKFYWESRTDTVDNRDGPYDFTDSNDDGDSYVEFLFKRRLKEVKLYDTDPDVDPNAVAGAHSRLQYAYLPNWSEDKLTLTEIQRLDPNDSSHKLASSEFAYLDLQTTGWNKGAMIEITFPEGGSNTITYELGCAEKYRVDQIVSDDGMGNTYTTDYTWAGSQSYENNTFCGHATVEVDLPGSDYGKIKYTHETVESTHLLGALEKVEYFKQGTSTIVQTVENTWSTIDKSDGSYFRKLDQVDTEIDGITNIVAYAYNTSNGLPSEITEEAEGTKKRITEIDYAFQESAYSGTNGMDDKHMLSAVSQQIVHINYVGQYTASSSAVTTYRDWGSGEWAANKTYSWLEDEYIHSITTFDFNNWSGEAEPPSTSEWLKTSKILSRCAYGNVMEAEDANGNVTTTKWNSDAAFPIAPISNATNSESMYDGFESGDFSGGQEIGWGQSGSGTREVTDEDAFSGKYALKFTKVDAGWSGVYLNSPYVDVTAGEAYTISFWYKCEPARQASINWYDQTNSKSHYSPAYSGTGKWEYAEFTFVAPLADPQPCTEMRVYLYGHSGSPNTPIYYDDVRVYPSDAMLSSTAYDPATLQITSQSDETGATSFVEYDPFNRPIRTRNDDFEILAATTYSDHAFSSSAPNFVEDVSFPNGNYGKNWGFEDDPSDPVGWSAYYDGQISLVDKSVVQPNFGNYVLKVYDNSSDSDPDGAFFDFYNGENSFSNDDEFHALVGQPVTFSAWVRTASGTKTLRIGIEGNSYETYSVGTDWQRISAHLASLNYEEPTPTENYPKRLRCNITLDGTQTGTFYIDGVVLELTSSNTPTELLVSTSYQDGLGRTLQTQTRSGDNDIVNHQVLNNLGLVATTYESFEHDTDHNFLAVGSFPGGLATQSQTYYDDPLGRVKKVTPFGNASTDAVDYSYGSESPSFSTDTYRFVEVNDEEGKEQKDYFDKLGNLVGRVSAVGTSDEITAEYEYDILGNLETTTDPRGLASTNVYNTLGQLTSTTTPDEGTIKYIYDKNGNLRFSQDENLRTDNDFMVYYYDALNRLTHEGVEKDQSFNWTSSFPSITNTDYGTEDDEWKVKLSYDQDFVGSGPNFVHGRLTLTETNDDADSNVDHSTKYVYDRLGNIIAKHVLIDEGNNISEKVIRHDYDKLGRDILLVYPSGLTVSNSYDEVGRLKQVSVIK